MAKRQKTVFQNAQLCHVWAQQNQEYGRNSSDTLYFKDGEIFSYGSHYKAAKIHMIKGKKIALVNSHNYSMSTAMHLGYIRSALQGLMPFFSVSNVDSLKDASEELDKKGPAEIESALKRVKIDSENSVGYQLERISDLYKEANEMRKLIGKKPITFKIADKKQIREHFKKRFARYKELNTPEMIKKREEQSAKRAVRKHAEAISKFRQGESVNLWSLKLPFDILRIQGDEVISSRGARVPLKDARLLLKAILGKKSVKGLSIGHYTVIGVTEGVVQIGCHKIQLSEAQAVLS